jgi:hypothetical protein
MNESENEFMNDASKSFIVSVGMKRHGKTFMMLQYLKHSLENNIFDHYFLVLPQYGQERDLAYQFLNNYKTKVTIYPRYSEVISKKLLLEMGRTHNFFAIDDATGELGNNFDDSLKKLVTCNEHGKCCAIWMCIHAGRRVLPPLARGMLNYLFLYYTTNQLMLKGFWEEYFSVRYRKFDDFLTVYNEAVERQIDNVGKVNAIMFSVGGNHEMIGITDWDLSKKKDFKILNTKKKGLKLQEVDPDKEKIMKSHRFAELKRELTQPKKPTGDFISNLFS